MVQHLGRSPASGELQRPAALTMAMGQPVGVRARVLFALLALCTAGLFAATLWGEWRPAWKKARRVLSAGAIDAGATVATDDGRVPQIHDAAAGVVDRCIACHAADVKPRQPWYAAAAAGHPSPLLEVHDVQVIGCSSCHDGQGRATRLPDAHGETPEWRLPLLRGALVQASCARCHSAATAPRAPLLRRGARLMQHHACDGCHQISGPDRRGKIGPNLAFAAHRAPPEWLWAWLKRPRDLLPGARMGNFGLSDEQAADLVAYLSHIKAPPPWPAAASGDDDDDATEAQLDARYEAGLRVFRTARCLSCHAVAGVGGSIGPDLAHIGNKLSAAALDAWIENPARFHPGTRMPRFRLSPSDRAALVYYLSEETRDPDVEDRLAAARERYGALANAASSDRGATLFAERGCGGCHATTADAAPATNIKRVGPELVAFGSKRVERLVFPDDWHGQRTRVAWTRAKLSQPRSTSKTDIMPSFELSEDDLDALLVATLALREPWPEAFRAGGPLVEPEPQTPPGPAGELMSELRCLVCHRLGGSGGSLAPPLDAVGSRLQYDWLREFLLAPDTVRPGLVERMPHFYLTRVEAETLARYFEAACQRRELPVLNESHDGAVAAVAGAALYEQFECRACHIVGANGGSLGPNLTRVAQRLQPRWMALQLGDPRAAEVDEPVFDLDATQVQQLVAYLETLHGDASRVAAASSETDPSSRAINQPR